MCPNPDQPIIATECAIIFIIIALGIIIYWLRNKKDDNMTKLECNDCKWIFKLPKSTDKYLEKHNMPIICPKCGSTTIAWGK